MGSRGVRVVLAVLALAAACQARSVSKPDSRRQMLASAPGPWVDPADLRQCGEMLPDSLSPPQHAVVAAVFAARGTENYTCIDGKWTVIGSRKDLYHAGTGEFAGYLYAEASDIQNSRYVFTDASNTTFWGDAVKDNQVTYDYKPLDPSVNRKWWRRHLLTATGVAGGSVLVIKTDVSGGMAPNEGKCSEDEQGQELFIPMNNTYTFYACRNHVLLPKPQPKCEPPALEGFSPDGLEGKFIVAWTAQASGTRNWTCSGGQPVFDGTVCDIPGGKCYYTPPAFNQSAGRVGYFVVDLPGGSYYMDTLRNTTAPAPEADTLDWAAWPVAKMRGEPLCDYLVRYNTTGGATPGSCGSTAEGGEITVPFTAGYACLQCD